MNIKPVSEFYYDKKNKKLTIICQPVSPSYPTGPAGAQVEDVFIKNGEGKNDNNKFRFPFKCKGEQQEEVYIKPKQLSRQSLSCFKQRKEGLQRRDERPDTILQREVRESPDRLYGVPTNEEKI